jgi:hypothetical protein
VEWVGEVRIQIGAHDVPPPEQMSPFLAGFVRGVAAHAAVGDAELLESDAFNPAQLINPTRHVRFRFLAGSHADAERVASEEVLQAGIRSGIDVLEPRERELGWMASVEVQPA